jgi:hypothetical protein
MLPELTQAFPQSKVIDRTSIGAWDDTRFVATAGTVFATSYHTFDRLRRSQEGAKMKTSTINAALIPMTLMILLGGCVATPEHRMNVAAARDDTRRSEFEHCRAEGRSDCDAILNAPVDSAPSHGDSVREQERHQAYDRCMERNGTDCDDLLRRPE